MSLTPVVLLAILFSLNATTAPASSECSRKEVKTGAVHAYRLQSQNCLVSVTGFEKGELYRSYVFSSNGTAMVFNVFDTTGYNSKDTGARTYFLFPRQQIPDFKVLPDGDLLLVTSSGETVVFSHVDSTIKSFGSIEFREELEISGTNNGGVDLFRGTHPILDTGWAVGNAAFVNPYRDSAFLLPDGRICSLSNKEVFDYAEDRSDPPLKFKTDAALDDFLKERCP